MDLQERKIHFVQAFLRLNDESIIHKLEDTLKFEKSRQAAREIKPYTSDEFQKKIDRAEEDAKLGKVRTTGDLKEDMKSWG